VKPAIPAPSNNAELIQLKRIVIAGYVNLPNIPFVRGTPFVMAYFNAAECRDAAVVFPPRKIARIKDVRPRSEPITIVDGYYSASSFGEVDRRFRCGRSSCDNGDGFTSPSRPPIRGSVKGSPPSSTSLASLCGAAGSFDGGT
jgi:hypothetical protein